MTEHAVELVPILGYVIVTLIVVLKGLLILGYRNLASQLRDIQTSLTREAQRIHKLEIRVARIETKLGIENHTIIEEE